MEGNGGIGAASAIQHPIDREHGQRFEKWPDLERRGVHRLETELRNQIQHDGLFRRVIGCEQHHQFDQKSVAHARIFGAGLIHRWGMSLEIRIVKECGPLRYGPAL